MPPPRKPIEFVDAVWLREPAADSDVLTVSLMRRKLKSDRVRLDGVRVPSDEMDREFVRLYSKFLENEISGAVTRISDVRLQLGFWSASEGRLVVDPIDDGNLALMRAQVRAGARPLLCVYSPNAATEPRFICSDDMLALRAYRAEGISVLPCLLLNPDPSLLEHGAFLVNTLPTAPDRPMAVTGTMTPSSPKLARVLGEQVEGGDITICDGFRELREQLIRALRRLRRFHEHGAAETHYHHCLSSAVTRAARITTALLRTGVSSLPDASAVLVRALYELWLSVYLDWLAPELVGPAFQIHALSTRRLRAEAMNQLGDRMRQNGWTTQDVQQINRGRERVFKHVESPGERARLNPCAILHEKIYSRLCQYAHQDFAAGSPFLKSLTRDVSPMRFRPANAEEHARFLLQVSDIAVGGIVWCLITDTGHPRA